MLKYIFEFQAQKMDKDSLVENVLIISIIIFFHIAIFLITIKFNPFETN
jgi:hypothetical protein